MNFERATTRVSGLAGRMLTILLLCSLLACAGRSEQLPGQVDYEGIERDSCLAQPEHAYHILLPQEMDRNSVYPLLIVLDAHGDGRMAVEKFKEAVRYFPCLVAGSDLVRNNFEGFENAIMQLLDDLMAKYPVDRKHIVISGFSGGARMAYYFSLRYPVSGLLMCGAGPGADKPSCPVFTVSGMGDFNFAEQYMRPGLTLLSDDRYTSDYFHGIHEWPQPRQLSDALLVLYKDLGSTAGQRQKRSLELLRNADSLLLAGDEIMAWKAIEKCVRMAVRASVRKKAAERGNEMLQDSRFQEAIRTLERDLNDEAQMQQEYPRRLLLENAAWWEEELTILKNHLSEAGPGMERDHYLRVKGYVGILLYSMINRMIHNDPGNPQLQVMLNVYAFAEPENPDVYFFMALDAYHRGERTKCIASIERSLKLGFTDRDRLRAAFPDNILQSVSR